ncbi:MAG: nucleoside triphosphate pyrophosphohydrolase, partial [Deltaproteobacteria bacterium]|nr:nucleoside triphosphate pyrophosphohydrolase [Deltaproteobacteria bacterium]
ELISIMERLRAPGGCPWDREQTTESLVPFIIEEAYEVIAAIDAQSPDMLKDELGDLLFQIIFLCQLAGEEGQFTMEDVIKGSVKKMVRRHPHVFADEKAENTQEVLKNWARIKKEERGDGNHEGYLSGIPEQLPALLRAHKVTAKAARVGFDWKDIEGAFGKVDEEFGEFREAVRKRDSDNMEEEFGDILFTLVNVGRFAEINPEDALRKTIGKFIRRFHFLEDDLR